MKGIILAGGFRNPPLSADYGNIQATFTDL